MRCMHALQARVAPHDLGEPEPGFPLPQSMQPSQLKARIAAREGTRSESVVARFTRFMARSARGCGAACARRSCSRAGAPQ